MTWIDLLKVSVILLLFFNYCTQDYKLLKEESREQYANLRFSKFKRIEYKGIGIKKWELTSEEAYFYQEEKTEELQKIIVYNFTFNQFLPQPSTFKAEKAYLDYSNEIMKLEGNAEYQDKEIILKSNYLEYNLKNDILNSNEKVSIKRKGSELDCLNGFYYNKIENIQICRKPSGKYIQPKIKNEQNKQNDFFF